MSEPLQPAINRAQRRFLGLTLPYLLTPEREDFIPLEHFALTPAVQAAMKQHLKVAGEMRGGSLLGQAKENALLITGLIPSGVGLCSPYHPDPAYLLGALEAAQQYTGVAVDWVGSWVIPADGLTPTPQWSREAWPMARRMGLVSPYTALMTFGLGDERLEYGLWTEVAGKPAPLTPFV